MSDSGDTFAAVAKVTNAAADAVRTGAAEVSFVKANWGKLSAVVVAAFVLGWIAAKIL